MKYNSLSLFKIPNNWILFTMKNHIIKGFRFFILPKRLYYGLEKEIK
jgi:hypothetical protein